jgi:hypothetical protein
MQETKLTITVEQSAFQNQTFSSAAFPRKSSAYVLALVRETIYHTHTKQQVKLQFYVF